MMKNERIWSYVKETTSHLQNKLIKNIHLGVATRSSTKWDCLKPIRFHQLNYLPFYILDSNGIPSCTSAGCVLQLCKVSLKFNKQFSRSSAYKVHPSPLFVKV
jgi:hypothetical protein